jgi:hypothetical protein
MDKKNVIKFLLAGIIIVIVLRLITNRKNKENYHDGWEGTAEAYEDYDPAAISASEIPSTTLVPGATMSPTVAPAATLIPSGTMGPMSRSVDLLPKPSTKSSEFGEYAPKSLQGQSFLNPTSFIGQDSVGASLKNANYSLRRDIPIAKSNVGPWSNSSVEADLYRKPLDC